MNTSNVARNIMFAFALVTVGFVAGMHANKPAPVQAAVVAPATHEVNGMILTDAQYNEQLSVQKAANDKMEADYASTLVQEKAANDQKMDQLVIALAKKAKQDHGLWIASPVKHNTSL